MEVSDILMFYILAFPLTARANHTITGGHTIGHSPIGDKLRRFNDSDSWNHGRISAIRMLCGQYLLALQVQYNGLWATKHGFWNPKCTENQSWTPTHYFGEDEWIDRAELTGGWYTSSITLTTNKRRLETCGIPVESPTFQESGRLEYVSGIFGCYFDRLQLHWSLARCPSGKLITGDINDCKSCPIGTCKNNSLEIFGAECTPCTDSTTQSIARNASQSSTLRANHTTTEVQDEEQGSPIVILGASVAGGLVLLTGVAFFIYRHRNRNERFSEEGRSDRIGVSNPPKVDDRPQDQDTDIYDDIPANGNYYQTVNGDGGRSTTGAYADSVSSERNVYTKLDVGSLNDKSNEYIRLNMYDSNKYLAPI